MKVTGRLHDSGAVLPAREPTAGLSTGLEAGWVPWKVKRKSHT